MKKALVLTVGTGTRADSNIVVPLVKTVKNSNPNFVVFICSENSKTNAEKIASSLTLVKGGNCRFIMLEDPDNLEKSFLDINAAFRFLTRKAYENGDITIDFTSGTKAMTSALVLAGVAFNCGEIKYISGDRKNGIVISGMERFINFEPNRLRAFGDLTLARNLILELRFDTARDILEKTSMDLLPETDKKRRSALTHITAAYGYWDKFDHIRFKGEIEQVRAGGDPALTCFLPDEETTETLLKIGRDVKKGKITWEVMADITCNAERRFDEGKFDDALARVYRLTEMLAQMTLLKTYSIDPSDVVLDKVPEDLRGRLAPNRNPEGKIQIGLAKDYELLNALGDNLGLYFIGNKKFQDLLKKRNRTILAHGLIPINKKECRQAFDYFNEMAAIKNPEFQRFCGLLTFPWRKQ